MQLSDYGFAVLVRHSLRVEERLRRFFCEFTHIHDSALLRRDSVAGFPTCGAFGQTATKTVFPPRFIARLHFFILIFTPRFLLLNAARKTFRKILFPGRKTTLRNEAEHFSHACARRKKLFFLASGTVFSFTFSAFYCKIERKGALGNAEAFYSGGVRYAEAKLKKARCGAP